MKKTVLRIVVTTFLLLAFGSTPVVADGSLPPPPWCPPGSVCN